MYFYHTVPGIMGSRLTVKDTRSNCSTNNQFKSLWVGVRVIEKCGLEELQWEIEIIEVW